MKNILKLLIIITVCSCSNITDTDLEETINQDIKIDEISPLKLKIGDTLTVKGSNLNRLNYIVFENNNGEYPNFNDTIKKYSFINSDENTISVIIPDLIHENVKIKISNTEKYDINLVGFFKAGIFNARDFQLIDENIAFNYTKNRFYKSTDGFYNWDLIHEFNKESIITSIYFLNENLGWVAVMDSFGRSIYYTNNGGKDFNKKYTINNLPNTILDGSDIRKIKFISENKGFFKDGNGNVFVATNDTFENIYNSYPELSSLPFGKIGLFDFNVVNENLLFLSGNSKFFLIKIENNQISYSQFNEYTLTPQFIDENTYFLQGRFNIFESNDKGNTWEEISTFNNDPKFHFYDKSKGLLFVTENKSDIVYKTNDGGKNWLKYHSFKEYDFYFRYQLYENIGLLRSSKGRIWKYIQE